MTDVIAPGARHFLNFPDASTPSIGPPAGGRPNTTLSKLSMTAGSSGPEVEETLPLQRASRRRRNADEDLTPAEPARKKARTRPLADHNATANGPTSIGDKKKSRKTSAYDENDDGFQFTRGKNKRAFKAESTPAVSSSQIPGPASTSAGRTERETTRPRPASVGAEKEPELLTMQESGMRAPNGNARPAKRSARLAAKRDADTSDHPAGSQRTTSSTTSTRNPPHSPEELKNSNPLSTGLLTALPHSRSIAGPSSPPSSPATAPSSKTERNPRGPRQDPPDKTNRNKTLPKRNDIISQARAGTPPPTIHKPTTIALPFSDTPIIRRNKEMRKNGGQGHRRSSVGLRGRRASSLIDSGMSTAIPHSEVPTSEFFKHIDQQMLEPKRMKCLLTWCAARAKPRQTLSRRGNANEVLVDEAVRQIASDVIKDVSIRDELSNWFVREDDLPPTHIIKKPNPRNIQMQEKARQLEAEIARLKAERRSWEEIQNVPLKEEKVPISDLSNVGPKPLDRSLLDDEQISVVASLFANPSSEGSNSSLILSTTTPVSSSSVLPRLGSVLLSLEPVVDAFTDGIHRIEQFRMAGGRMIDHLLQVSAEYLDYRDREERDRDLVVSPNFTQSQSKLHGQSAHLAAQNQTPDYQVRLDRVTGERRIRDIGCVLGVLAGALAEKDEDDAVSRPVVMD